MKSASKTASKTVTTGSQTAATTNTAQKNPAAELSVTESAKQTPASVAAQPPAESSPQPVAATPPPLAVQPSSNPVMRNQATQTPVHANKPIPNPPLLFLDLITLIGSFWQHARRYPPNLAQKAQDFFASIRGIKTSSYKVNSCENYATRILDLVTRDAPPQQYLMLMQEIGLEIITEDFTSNTAKLFRANRSLMQVALKEQPEYKVSLAQKKQAESSSRLSPEPAVNKHAVNELLVLGDLSPEVLDQAVKHYPAITREKFQQYFGTDYSSYHEFIKSEPFYNESYDHAFCELNRRMNIDFLKNNVEEMERRRYLQVNAKILAAPSATSNTASPLSGRSTAYIRGAAAIPPDAPPHSLSDFLDDKHFQSLMPAAAGIDPQPEPTSGTPRLPDDAIANSPHSPSAVAATPRPS